MGKVGIWYTLLLGVVGLVRSIVGNGTEGEVDKYERSSRAMASLGVDSLSKRLYGDALAIPRSGGGRLSDMTARHSELCEKGKLEGLARIELFRYHFFHFGSILH